MSRAPKICGEPGCPNFTPCPEHTPKGWAGRQGRHGRMRSGSKEQRINRVVMLQHEGICHVCGEPGADEIDHVIPLAESGPDTFDNRRPIHAIPCHRDKTQREAHRARTHS